MDDVGLLGGTRVLRRPREPVEVVGGDGVEPQRPRQRVQHLAGRVGVAALLEAQVVVRADAGQDGDLFAPQTRDPSRARAHHQTDVLRLQPITPCAQVVTQSARSGHSAR